jgi:hypothetical protein
LQYKESLKATHLVINAQVRRLFCSEDQTVAEWQEGRYAYACAHYA